MKFETQNLRKRTHWLADQILVPFLTAIALGVGGWWLLISLVFAESQTINYTYDGVDRLVTVVYGHESALHYQYDESGNRTRKIVVGPGNPQADHNTNTLYDLWELVYFQNLQYDPDADSDGDGMSNYEESRCWTDPTNALSLLQINSLGSTVVGSNDYIIIRWPSQTNAVYALDKSTNLLAAEVWSSLTNNIPATPPLNSYTDTLDDVDAIFYRIKIDE